MQAEAKVAFMSQIAVVSNESRQNADRCHAREKWYDMKN